MIMFKILVNDLFLEIMFFISLVEIRSWICIFLWKVRDGCSFVCLLLFLSNQVVGVSFCIPLLSDKHTFVYIYKIFFFLHEKQEFWCDWKKKKNMAKSFVHLSGSKLLVGYSCASDTQEKLLKQMLLSPDVADLKHTTLDSSWPAT